MACDISLQNVRLWPCFKLKYFVLVWLINFVRYFVKVWLRDFERFFEIFCLGLAEIFCNIFCEIFLKYFVKVWLREGWETRLEERRGLLGWFFTPSSIILIITKVITFRGPLSL